jgi:hypothetical protein
VLTGDRRDRAPKSFCFFLEKEVLPSGTNSRTPLA